MRKQLFKQLSWLWCLLCLLTALCACNQTAGAPQSTEIAVTPELRQEYFALARLNNWSYLPEFSSLDDLPADPLDYWFMIIFDGATGWDKHGDLLVESPWLKHGEVKIDSRFDPFDLNFGGEGYYLAISAAEFDAWLQQHFGAAPIKHEVSDPIATHHNKYYHYDGQTYYNTGMEGVWPKYCELTALNAQNMNGHTVYTAALNYFGFHEYCIFGYDDNFSPAENMEWYESMLENSPPENLAVYDVYGEQISQNQLSTDQAIEQMIIDGETANFRVIEQQTVQFYIDKKTQQPFYLSVANERFY